MLNLDVSCFVTFEIRGIPIVFKQGTWQRIEQHTLYMYGELLTLTLDHFYHMQSHSCYLATKGQNLHKRILHSRPTTTTQRILTPSLLYDPDP